MSQPLINGDPSQLDLIKKVSGSQRETVVREAFKDLLKAWGRRHELVFLPEYPLKIATRTHTSVDGALLHRVSTVSVETVKITEAMKVVAR